MDNPRSLMLGKGWFPEQLGGLDRYYRELLEHLPEASGVVIGPDPTVPPQVAAVGRHGQPLARRLLAFWAAAQRAAASTDVVDAHFALYALAPVLAGRLRTKPLVVHFHGPWAEESIAAGDGSRLRRAARLRLERTLYTRARETIVLSSAFRQVLVERYRVRPWAVTVVPPGVDLTRFSPGSIEDARRTFGIASGAFVAVAVRRLVPRMGIDLLLEAWEQAVRDMPEGSALLIAGDGPLRDELSSAVVERGLAPSVRLLGRVSDERLVELYRAADIAVVPSLEHEGFGLVVIEAAGCGTPTIVTAVGGLPETVGSLHDSLIVPAGDSAALRDRLLRAHAARPSRDATRAYAERFDWPAVAERHRAILRRAARPGRGDGRLKVVYLDHCARLSGGEIALLRLLPHLHGVNPHVILAEDGPLVGRLHAAGISTEVLPFGDDARQLKRNNISPGRVGPAVAASTGAYIARVAARLRHLRPDLVHTNSLKAGVYGSLAARLVRVPLIWHVRDRIAEDYIPRSAVALVRGMTRYLATAVVANSRSTLETLQAPPRPVVLYSVLPEVLQAGPVRGRTTNGPLTFGIVGRLAPWKGQDVFLKAFAEAFPSGEERAVVVGGALFGEHDYADTLPRLADALGIAERVELRGQRPDVWEELSRIDVLVHASVTPEPFGQVILEGMAAGVPVIAAGAGGPAEILEHEVTGVLYEPADVVGLATTMRRMQDPSLRQRLTTAARDGLAPYSPSVVADELQQLYHRVVSGRRGWGQ